jgi:hypothetical protein
VSSPHIPDGYSPTLDSPGGQFEFLPVTVVSEGVVLKGVLRVGLKLGLEVGTGGIASALDKTPFNFEAGIVAEVFANVAEFITNVTGPTLSSKPKDNKSPCSLSVIEQYQFALGAAAGATVAVGFQTWGPVASESTPLFYTTLSSACAMQKSPPPVSRADTVSPTAPTSGGTGLTPRQAIPTAPTSPARPTAALSTFASKTTLHFTAQSCKSSGLINCPASLQVSSTYKTIVTLTTAVPSGVKPTFPLTKVTSVESPVPFGTGMHKMVESTGAPTSFVPSPTGAVGDIKTWLEGTTGTLGNKVLLGLVVGLGVPVLIGIVAGAV